MTNGNGKKDTMIPVNNHHVNHKSPRTKKHAETIANTHTVSDFDASTNTQTHAKLIHILRPIRIPIRTLVLILIAKS